VKDNFLVYHFSVGREGGVHTVIKNLILYSKNDLLSHRVIYLINNDIQSNLKFNKSIDYKIFTYSKFENLYFILKKIKTFIQDRNVILACHDWLELALISNLGLQYPVVFFMHGEYPYYFETAKLNESFINKFISPTLSIKAKLDALLPHRKRDIIYQPFPVYNLNLKPETYHHINCAFYVCDLNDTNKNFSILPRIDERLRARGYFINWHIGGGGLSQSEFLQKWSLVNDTRVKYYGFLDIELLKILISASNVFILPSFNEGMQISLIESMQSGLVPIVNNWGNSVTELIENGINGFIVDGNDLDSYVDIIVSLNDDAEKFKKISDSAKLTTLNINEPYSCVEKIESVFKSIKDIETKRVPKKNYGSRLDNPYIPTLVTRSIRKILHRYSW
jgi:glycosyltransferase involved in cell wall biosynthesis